MKCNRFLLEALDLILERISCGIAEGKTDAVLDIVNGSTGSGAGIQLYGRNDTMAQAFILVPVSMEDAFYIINAKSLLALDVDNAGNRGVNHDSIASPPTTLMFLT
ncbi:MAG: RICIN domain-containing protein [Actinobacteria bacterium]|nr:RICIN domain-containing protein [Actinomycetota bacterium]